MHHVRSHHALFAFGALLAACTSDKAAEVSAEPAALAWTPSTTGDATEASVQGVSHHASPTAPGAASTEVASASPPPALEPSPASPTLQQAVLVPPTLAADAVTAPLAKVAEPRTQAEAVPDLAARPLPVGWARWAEDGEVLLFETESDFGHCYDGEPVYTHNSDDYIALVRPLRESCIGKEFGGFKDRTLRVIGPDGEICTVKVTGLVARSEYIDRGDPAIDEADRYKDPPLVAWENGEVRLWGTLAQTPGDCASPSAPKDLMDSVCILTPAEQASPPFAARAKCGRPLDALARRTFKATRRNVALQATFEDAIKAAKSRTHDTGDDNDDDELDDEDGYDIAAEDERLLLYAAKVKRWDRDMATTCFVDRVHGRELVTVEASNDHFCAGGVSFVLATTFEVTRDGRGKANLSEIAQSTETPIALVDLDADGGYELLLRGGGPCDKLRVETAQQEGPGTAVMYRRGVLDRSWNESAASERYDAQTERECRCQQL